MLRLFKFRVLTALIGKPIARLSRKLRFLVLLGPVAVAMVIIYGFEGLQEPFVYLFLGLIGVLAFIIARQSNKWEEFEAAAKSFPAEPSLPIGGFQVTGSVSEVLELIRRCGDALGDSTLSAYAAELESRLRIVREGVCLTREFNFMIDGQRAPLSLSVTRVAEQRAELRLLGAKPVADEFQRLSSQKTE